MIQSPCAPQYYQPQMVQPQIPQCNAVKIDIINPQAGVPGMCPPATPQPTYAQPTAPMYQYPQAPVYTYPQAPVDMQPGYYPPVAPQQYPQQVNVNYPQGPVPPMQQPVPPAPVEPAAPAQVPQPQVSNPEVVPSQPVQPEVDLNGFIAKLTNPSFGEQKACMEEIAKMIKEDEKNGTQRSDALVDTGIYKALSDIINFDSSKLAGPTQEQIDLRQKILDKKEVTEEQKALANTMSDMEQAELNKSYALFTIAMLDKWYGDEIERLSNTKTPVPLTDLPEIVNVVNQLKDNPNPMVRSSAIEALSYIQRPEYKKDLSTLFELAKKDQDSAVALQAEEALKKLEQLQ